MLAGITLELTELLSHTLLDRLFADFDGSKDLP